MMARSVVSMSKFRISFSMIICMIFSSFESDRMSMPIVNNSAAGADFDSSCISGASFGSGSGSSADLAKIESFREAVENKFDMAHNAHEAMDAKLEAIIGHFANN